MQDLLDLVTAEMKELEEETRGTWSDFILLMGFSHNFSLLKPARVDEAIFKDSRTKIQVMLKKVGPLSR
jgi:hypothetical protein